MDDFRLWRKKKLEMLRFAGKREMLISASFNRREAFRVSASKHQDRVERKRKLRNRQRRIERRLRDRAWAPQDSPMFRASNIHYEVAEKTRGLACGGIGAMHLLVRRVGLIEAIDRDLHLLKIHKPYHESDHVLNLAYNILAGGDCMEDLELLRNDEVYLDALGAQRIPDPTTAADFCRRFAPADVQTLQDTIHEVRLGVWAQQPRAFFEEAVIDADGSHADTYGECKQGIGLSYDGQWSYHPLIISLRHTQEPLYLKNRPGNRPSHEGAAAYFDDAAELCTSAGFRRITFCGDTDFSQTAHLDRWHQAGHRFVFGFDAMPNLVQIANELPASAWAVLPRPAKYEVKTEPRGRRENVREQIIRENGYKNIKLKGEQVAEFAYQPTACVRPYRMIVVRKNLSVEQGQAVLFEDCKYFFYITNDMAGAESITRGMVTAAAELVYFANRRCNQENLIAQLKHGVHALDMPVGDLTSNEAYMVMASLAWTLKAWFALLLPEPGGGIGGESPQALGRWREKYQAQKRAVLSMEFKTFLNAFMRLPCQLVRAGRRVLFRLLNWNPSQSVLLRGVDALRCPLRC